MKLVITAPILKIVFFINLLIGRRPQTAIVRERGKNRKRKKTAETPVKTERDSGNGNC